MIPIVHNQVLLVGVDFGVANFDIDLKELSLLAETANLKPVGKIVCKRKTADAKLFLGSGKVEEIKSLVLITGAKEIIFDQTLSPSQQRNLENYFQLPVNDKTYLILAIFAQRAHTSEGKLQVELARLEYLSTRLVRRWSHLERQRGGIGVRGGPGESQIELDRRMIVGQIRQTKERLLKLQNQRFVQKKKRNKNDVFKISIVGYTNVGKSTLFNALTNSQEYTADRLFATLDTVTRKLFLPDIRRSVTISDTVGFIKDLPHTLINAFRSTLQETIDADLLLHVVDSTNLNYLYNITQVQKVLVEISADVIPQLIVFNKIDSRNSYNYPNNFLNFIEIDGIKIPCVFISAKNSFGLNCVREKLTNIIND